MKKIITIILIILISASLGGHGGGHGGGHDPGCGHHIPDSLKVLIAISQLFSDDCVVSREAISVLDDHADVPNVFLAIYPLILLVNDYDGRRDVYTRCQAVPVLVHISLASKNPHLGQQGIEAVIDLLSNSSSDMVRASCASALGVNGQTQAIPDIENSLNNDPSVFVQTHACKALIKLTNGTYLSDTCGYEYEETPPPEEDFIRSSGVAPLSDDTEDYLELKRWYDTHILVPLPEGNGQ